MNWVKQTKLYYQIKKIKEYPKLFNCSDIKPKLFTYSDVKMYILNNTKYSVNSRFYSGSGDYKLSVNFLSKPDLNYENTGLIAKIVFHMYQNSYNKMSIKNLYK